MPEKPLHSPSEELQLGKQLSEQKEEKKEKSFSLAAKFPGARSVLE